jgi:CRISPR-associated exonuclease Cas4
VTFNNLDDHDKTQFAKYLTVDNKIRVRKSITKGGSPVYNGYCQIPDEEWLREEKPFELLQS